jgi:hypothetical protein
MDENEKNVAGNTEPSSPDKKLKLDLSQALTPDSDDDDDIIELKDEIALPPKEEEAEIVVDEASAAESSDDAAHKKRTLDLEAEMDTEALENDLPEVDELLFEEEDEIIEDETFDEEEIQPLVAETPAETGGSDEVIEITEFDDILSEDANEMVTLTDDGEALDSEEEFLELIDVEEDHLPEEADEGSATIEDEIIQFEGLEAEVEDVELEDFINDTLNEEIRIDDELEDELTDTLGVGTDSEMRMSDETPEEEDLDFNLDPEEIAEKIDQVDTIFFDETPSHADLAKEPSPDAGLFEDIASDTAEPQPEIEEEPQFEEEIKPLTDLDTPEELPPAIGVSNLTPEESDTGLFEDIAAETVEPANEIEPGPEIEEEIKPLTDVDTPDELPPVVGVSDLSPEQIEESIERVIEQNFSEKIESMVSEVIEKAVTKEIDRLKRILLDDDANDRF